MSDFPSKSEGLCIDSQTFVIYLPLSHFISFITEKNLNWMFITVRIPKSPFRLGTILSSFPLEYGHFVGHPAAGTLTGVSDLPVGLRLLRTEKPGAWETPAQEKVEMMRHPSSVSPAKQWNNLNYSQQFKNVVWQCFLKNISWKSIYNKVCLLQG